jgi:chromate reductase, NAD(P)H dehydrogenase (quinone)
MNGPILVIAGTNRPDANALKIANLLLSHYKSTDVPAELYSLADLPTEIFSPTAYATKPPVFQHIQEKVVAARGLHVVTPEYNGSFPGILKYFIDMLKFPESFERKPVAFVGEAAGIWGGFRAVEQLQMIFGYRNAHTYPERVFIPGIMKQLGPDGRLLDASLDERLAAQVRGFVSFVKALSGRV